MCKNCGCLGEIAEDIFQHQCGLVEKFSLGLEYNLPLDVDFGSADELCLWNVTLVRNFRIGGFS